MYVNVRITWTKISYEASMYLGTGFGPLCILGGWRRRAPCGVSKLSMRYNGWALALGERLCEIDLSWLAPEQKDHKKLYSSLKLALGLSNAAQMDVEEGLLSMRAWDLCEIPVSKSVKAK